MSIRTVLIAVAVASSSAYADDGADGVKALTAAAARHDDAAILKLFDTAVQYDGLWFANADCASKLDRPHLLIGHGREILARCLAKLELAPSPRRSARADAGVVVAKPGIELAVQFASKRLIRIGFVAPGTTPTITAAALEQQRIAGARKLAAKPAGSVWMVACIDARGAVSRSTPIDPRLAGGVGLDAAAVIAGWKFRPFKLGGKAIAVTALVRFGDDAATETVPAMAANPCDDDKDADANGAEGGVEGGVAGGVVGGPPTCVTTGATERFR